VSSPRSTHYILVEGQPVPADFLTWMHWFAGHEEERIVKKTEIGHFEISTVFLGLDHNFLPDGPPLIYETMVFDRSREGMEKFSELACERYSTLELTRLGHEEHCDRVRKEHQLQ
jgi:hypothetical protein